ncbi:hypothetical protein AAH979_07080 [Plantactinospora sp. ZYX-F-223]|uniref:hypothetical protein n=1 Tax=Plantactinospora sp. ZYX-F-223 TaxID=3144103 RepID=UPI0031FCDAB6
MMRGLTPGESRRASYLVQAEHVSDGLRHAADNELLHEVARQVVAVVPSGTARSDVAELEARIPTIRT